MQVGTGGTPGGPADSDRHPCHYLLSLIDMALGEMTVADCIAAVTEDDIITGTLGKALGGASGGYTSGRKEIIDLLRQRSRPYLFSNSVAPAIVGASLELLDMLEESTDLRDHLEEVTTYYRKKLVDNGFDIIEGTHPCVPVMLYDEKMTAEFARRMMDKGIYVVAFSYPVVPKGKARIRTQVCASHTKEDIDRAVQAFIEVREEMNKG